MNSSFYNGLVGMKTSQMGVDIWSDNIANTNTIGFKQQTIDFSSLFSSSMTNDGVVTSDIGVGAVLGTTTMDLKQGSIISTDEVFDLALSGDGWFAINDSSNNTMFTRTGTFMRDKNGTLVNQNGQKLQLVNANNLYFENGEWKFDYKIDTSNLVTPQTTPNQLSSIDLPDNITFPGIVTQNIKIGGNLPNGEIAENTKPATINSDFGVLYDNNSHNLNLKDGQDIVFGFGENIKYEDGLIRNDVCISDDEEDGEDVNIDFDINGVNIKTTIADGSSAKEIVDAIADVLDDNDILYDKSDNSIQLKDDKKIIIKNNGDYFSNVSIAKLTYQSNPKDIYDFTSVSDFIDLLQNLADNVYDNVTTGINEKGKLFINNNNDKQDIVAQKYSTEATNMEFYDNILNLANVIKPNTASTSLSFYHDYQGFSGDIIDKDGNRNQLKFDFLKTKLDGEETIWTLNLSEIDKDKKIISTKTEQLKFNSKGALLTPDKIEFNNTGETTIIDLGKGFEGITSTDKNNVGFSYSQDGVINGYLTSYDVNDMGEIIANFSNAKSGILGQIPIYHFRNEQGLDSLGRGVFTITNNSGEALLYSDSEGNYLQGSKIKNYSLEASNVNMTQALTELIVTQKAFDANSKSITTSDQFIQKAIDMKR